MLTSAILNYRVPCETDCLVFHIVSHEYKGYARGTMAQLVVSIPRNGTERNGTERNGVSKLLNRLVKLGENG